MKITNTSGKYAWHETNANEVCVHVRQRKFVCMCIWMSLHIKQSHQQKGIKFYTEETFPVKTILDLECDTID